MKVRLYGIPNCDKVRRARVWFARRALEFEFVDFKRCPPAPALIEHWLAQVGLEALLNRAGTTWRGLSQAARAAAEQRDAAIALMAAHPALIRRPVIERGATLLVGFDPDLYARTFDG